MKLKHALIGIAAVGGIALTSSAASAQPHRLPASRSHLPNIDEVRYVCDVYGFDGHPHFYGRPRAYGARHRGYPEDERDKSPAAQAAEEGGR
jgi:hypothetical protein